MTGHDYKGRAIRKKTHRRYSDNRDRPDLRALSLCCDMAGPVHDESYLTSEASEVTCGRCLRVMDPPPSRAKMPPSRPFSAADHRRMSRNLGPGPTPVREALPAMPGDVDSSPTATAASPFHIAAITISTSDDDAKVVLTDKKFNLPLSPLRMALAFRQKEDRELLEPYEAKASARLDALLEQNDGDARQALFEVLLAQEVSLADGDAGT